MRTWTDAVANVHGRVGGHNTERPVLLIGSHYDTVKDAGKYDGALGILVGTAAVKALVVQVSVHALSLQSSYKNHCMLHAASMQVSWSNPATRPTLHACHIWISHANNHVSKG